MTVLTADAAIKDDVLRGLGEPADYAAIGSVAGDGADDEHNRDVRYIYDDHRTMLVRKEMSKERFNEVMRKCRDREYARKTAERLRALNRMFAEGQAIALKYGITEDDVNEAIMEVREEMRAEKERVENK